MVLRITTAAVSRALTTPERVSQEIPDLDESKAADLIAEATATIERQCERPFGFGFATFEERLTGDGSPILQLEALPLFDIDTVLHDASTVIADYEVIDPETGWLYREVGWPVRLRGGGLLGQDVALAGRLDWTVRYRAGFVLPGDDQPEDLEPGAVVPDLPVDLERACIELVRALTETPVATGVSSERIGDYAVTYRDNDMANVLPPRVATLIAPYRRIY